MELSTAGLLERKGHLEPEPLEHGDGRTTDLRVKGVCEAGDEERNPQDNRLSMNGDGIATPGGVATVAHAWATSRS